MRLFLVIAGLLAASPALSLPRAAALPERAQAVLERGRPFVEVRPDPDGSSGMILAAIDVSAPQAVVWTVMTDCGLAPRMVANLKSCRILESDPQGRWDIREEVSRPAFAPSVRVIYREDFEPDHRMSFHRTGGDLAVFEGEWRLEPHGDQVRVTYEARVTAPFKAPSWVVDLALRHDVTRALLALRREATTRASQATP